MNLLTERLEMVVFDELAKSKKRIIIISPFVSTYTAKKLTSLLDTLKVDCTLITQFNRQAFIEGSSSIKALELLLNHNVQMQALKNLHSKVYIIDEHTCMTGSANFTKRGLTENAELLTLFNTAQDTGSIINYAQQLIQCTANYPVTDIMIQREKQIIETYNLIEPAPAIPHVEYNFGATFPVKIEKEAPVLSVAVGGTYDIIEKYLIHAHPISYPYKSTKYITFRYPKGGSMKAVYEIVDTLTLDKDNWKEAIEATTLSDDSKRRVIQYILNRQSDYGYTHNEPYKYYILKETCTLPKKPRPPQNNSGGWYYKFGDLINESVVKTIKI